MKSEHRHELQTNELGKIVERIVQGVNEHGNKITVGICVGSLVMVVGILWYRSAGSREASAWTALEMALDNASSPEDMQDVWDNHNSSSAAVWARLVEGEQRLYQGTKSMFLNDATGKEQLQGARAAFEAILGRRGVPLEVRERALFGAARVHEALSSGDPNDAVAAYERLLSEFPDSPHRDDAQKRVVALKTGASQEFYQWFASFERPKPVEKGPKDSGSDLDEEEDEAADDLRQKVKNLLDGQNATGDEMPEDEGEEDAPALSKPNASGNTENEDPAADDNEPAPDSKARDEGASSGRPPKPPVPEPDGPGA